MLLITEKKRQNVKTSDLSAILTLYHVLCKYGVRNNHTFVIPCVWNLCVHLVMLSEAIMPRQRPQL